MGPTGRIPHVLPEGHRLPPTWARCGSLNALAQPTPSRLPPSVPIDRDRPKRLLVHMRLEMCSTAFELLDSRPDTLYIRHAVKQQVAIQPTEQPIESPKACEHDLVQNERIEEPVALEVPKVIAD